jgi:hypothetical protein
MVKTITGSVYLINEEAKKIQRVSGAGTPTKRIGTDGEWKNYAAIDFDLFPGCLYIIWDGVASETEFAFRGTRTSKIAEIIRSPELCS